MPRIDPLQLLKCLSVLLKPNGGIKSKDEVQRLASLMTKFSKKLVSKCIYVSILKATETDLLIMFMSAGGWDLIYTWLSDGVIAKNWPLVNQLLDLLHVCPVDIERLKTNACPKLIKTLSKDYAAEENVRLLACKLVEQWLKIVRGEIEPVSVRVQPVKEEVNGEIIALNDVKRVNDSAGAKPASLNSTENIESEELPLVNVEDTRSESNPSENQLPVYKITIRDGKKLLAEVFSADRALVRSSGESTSTDPDIDDEESDEDIKPVKVSKKNYANKVKVNVKRPVQLKSDVSSRDSVDSNSSSTSNKSFRSREDRKQSGKRSRSFSPNRKSKIKSSANRDKQNIIKGRDKNSGKMSFNDKKNSDKSDKDKNIKIKSEKELQEEREFKESLSKIITPSISKLGKIPKKTNNTNKDEDDPKKESSKVSSSDIKKPIDYKKVPDIKKPEKKYSMSIGVKRSIDNDAKPKTVKTFNSKFRSTGLEETPPPPPKPVAKKPTIMPPPTIPEKKPNKRLSVSPDPQIPEKKTKSEPSIEERKPDKIGGIKLIPAKPKLFFSGWLLIPKAG
uniref:TFIIS N-terminal domain-containing protein n=1 Tax=Clastoptera arizonana TaxID=38151 RepID=A0A1B6D378_9HEMI